MTTPPGLDDFAALARSDDGDLELGRGALLVAKTETPGLDVDALVRMFDQYASRAADAKGADATRAVGIVNRVLYDEERYRGAEVDYYDTDNMLLDRVMARKQGIPISLATIYLETGWRVGLPLVGVAMPGHFLVKFAAADGELLVDVFRRGRVVTRRECELIVRGIYGGAVELVDAHLNAVSKRQILTRILYNLKAADVRAERRGCALRWTEMALLLNPWSVDDVRDRGLLKFTLDDFAGAADDLARYLEMVPKAADAAAVERRLAMARRLARAGR